MSVHGRRNTLGQERFPKTSLNDPVLAGSKVLSNTRTWSGITDKLPFFQLLASKVGINRVLAARRFKKQNHFNVINVQVNTVRTNFCKFELSIATFCAFINAAGRGNAGAVRIALLVDLPGRLRAAVLRLHQLRYRRVPPFVDKTSSLLD